jgi:hypothetical protein
MLTQQLLPDLPARLYSVARHPLVVMTTWLRLAWVLTV